jgi:glutamate racemase
MTALAQLPIGIFDSGIGGLTVVREIFRQSPLESVVYFGDTARVPYGTKSARVVRNFAMQDARFLMDQRVKMIVVACHTVSSVALQPLQAEFPLPIVGVVEPGVQAALAATRNNRIGVIGTKATILSRSYEKGFSERRGGVTVVSQACPLFVPLVEEGWLEGPVTEGVARIYLDPLQKSGIDTLVLGCTHYPLLKTVLQKIMGDSVVLIDSAEETAKAIQISLIQDQIQNPGDIPAGHRFFVSDIPDHFQRVGSLCLGRNLDRVEQIDLDIMEIVAKKNLA